MSTRPAGRYRLFKLLIVGGVVAGGAAAVPVAYAATAPTPTGFVKICKAGATTAVTGSFQFTVSGVTGTVTVPVGTCSKSIEVAHGEATVTEVARAGFVLGAVAAKPDGRLVSSNLTTGKATVKVPAGNTTSQTTVTFTNKVAPPPTGTLKVCKVAGPGVALGKEFAFTVGAAKTTAKAGACSAPLTLPLGDVTVTELPATGFTLTAIAVTGVGTLVSSDLAKGTAVVKIAVGATSVSFTNKVPGVTGCVRSQGYYKNHEDAVKKLLAANGGTLLIGGVALTAAQLDELPQPGQRAAHHRAAQPALRRVDPGRGADRDRRRAGPGEGGRRPADRQGDPCHHHRAEQVTLLAHPLGVARLGQRERPRDRYPYRTARHQGEHLREVLRHRHRPVTAAGEAHPVLRGARVGDGHHVLRTAGQLDGQGQHAPAGGVQDRVDAVGGRGPDPFRLTLAVLHRPHAQLAQEGVVARAGGTDDGGAPGAGELRGDQPHPAGHRVDQQGLARLEVEQAQDARGGLDPHRQRGRLFERQAVGLGHQIGGGGEDVGRRGPGRYPAQHRLPDPPPLDARPERVDRAGELQAGAGRRGQRPALREQALAHLPVEGVHTHRAHRDPHLAGAGLRGGDLLEAEHVGVAVAGVADGLGHGSSSWSVTPVPILPRPSTRAAARAARPPYSGGEAPVEARCHERQRRRGVV